jgi:HK97 family phage major capsid protein
MFNTNIVQLNNQLDKLLIDTRALYSEMEAASRKPDYSASSYNEKLDKMIADGRAIRSAIDLAKQSIELESMTKISDSGYPSGVGSAPTASVNKRSGSWGMQFVSSPAYKDMISTRSNKSNPVVVDGSIVSMDTRAVYGYNDTQGGHNVQVDRQPELVDRVPQRPIVLLDIIGKTTTNSDAVEYVEVSAKTNNADFVPERNLGNTDFGVKPESDISYALKTVNVHTIAHWMASSRQVLSDAPRLKNDIDTWLRQGLMLKLEHAIVNNASGGSGFTGILNTAGIQSRVHAVSGRDFNAADNIIDTLRRAITDIQLAFFMADGILCNPVLAEKMELLKDDNKQYLNVFDPLQQRLLRVPLVVSQVISATTAIVGNWSLGCRLWDREQTEVRVGEPNDFFLKNAVAVLAELRAAFAVPYPDMFEKVTGF